MKVVINNCFGGFGLSDAAQDAFFERSNFSGSIHDIERNNPDLVAIVEKMGELANGRHARLKIVEIPDDVNFIIEEYDGNEHIAEVHRTWY